jgi:hypothetical protein
MNKYLDFYKSCVLCKSKKFIKIFNKKFRDNFYLKAITSDLNLSNNFFSKIKTYQCKNCHIIQNNPWFNKDIYSQIFLMIYGQHNRSWSNLFNYLKFKKLPNHGKLFEILTSKINIKNYAEFNAPFTGLMLNFLGKEYNQDHVKINNLFKFLIQYLKSRQISGKSKKFLLNSEILAKKFLNKINFIKSKKIKKYKINKFLALDHTLLGWGVNDNYNSVNSRSLALGLCDLNIINIYESQKLKKFDLFGIFHSLDHTRHPKKILDYALTTSKYVLIYCHADPNIEKQHLFTITTEFIRYLKRKKLQVVDLTNKISKKYHTKELYFICSRYQSVNKFNSL